jgi:hypothetical protein
MAMKKTSGGNSPLQLGAGKSFWTLPIFGSMAVADRDVFWKSDRVFRFSHRGVFIGEEVASEVDQGAHTIGQREPGVGHAPGDVATLWSGSISSSVF